MIFGGRGDLAWRKLVPALFGLYLDGTAGAVCPAAVDRVETDATPCRAPRRRQAILPPRPADGRRLERFHGDRDATSRPTSTIRPPTPNCATIWLQIDAQWNAKANRVFYLATPPAMFGTIAGRLGEAGLSRDAERSHIVVEKPIGYDLDSARQLNAC